MKKSILRFIKRNKSNENDIEAIVRGEFDTEFYLEHYPEIRDAGIDPVEHYLCVGHDIDNDPTPYFSTSGYKARYPDVVMSGMNVFYHYLRHGRFENRLTLPISRKNLVHSDGGFLLSGGELIIANVATDRDKASDAVGLGQWLSSLDQEKVNGLLGIKISDARLRQWRVGVTSVLSEALDKDDDPKIERLPAVLDSRPDLNDSKTLSPPALPDGRNLAKQMLSAAEGKTLSLDVWDTILRRNCSPDAIKLRHARLQWLLDIDREGPLGNFHPLDLLQLRRFAEAQVADEHFEYRIGDAAGKLASLFKIPDADYRAKFLAREIAIEKTAISADSVVAELISKHEGRKIVLSDFYMPGSALQELLEHVGITSIKEFYSSSDHMATKRAGHLYDLALEREGLHPTDVLHLGDRFTADVTAATRRGIPAFHYFSPSHQPRLEKLEATFWGHFNADESAHAKCIVEALGHDRLANSSLETLAIAATGFVLHVLEEALRRKIDTVFFMTREGDFFKRIYDRLVASDVFDLGDYPKSALLEVSRRATFAASLEDFSPKSLMRLWSQYSTQSIFALATSLNIDVSNWEDVAKTCGLSTKEIITHPWQNEKFKSFIAHPHVLQIARDSLVRQNKELLDYLDAIGFEPRSRKDRLIVDIGWRGTIQDNLAEIVDGRIHGCYFGLEQFLNPQPRNLSKTGYVFDRNLGYPLDIKEVAAFEFLFNSCGGSTIGYQDGRAIREVIPGEEAIISGPVAEMQDRIIEAAGIVGDYVHCHGLISHDLVSLSREVATKFVERPPSEVVDAFFNLVHNETFGTGAADNMQLDLSAIRKLSSLTGSRLHGEASLFLNGLRWPEGARQLPDFKKMETKLTASQRLHLPVGPALLNPGSLGRPKIGVLSPHPILGSGGHRTIFNMAAALARHGYDVQLMHEGQADAETDEWICSVLGDAQITQHNAWLNWINPTASMATIWYSVDFIENFWPEVGCNFYFVQDYEAMFNPMGDRFLKAGQSYARGMRHISVGRWLAHKLRSEFGVGVASGGLGVDHKVYRKLEGVTRNQNQVAFLFQPEKYRRAPELCVAALDIVKKKIPETRIVVYGSDERPRLPFEYEHLGLINNVHDINRIYNESSAGLCISSTNPSRIPFEMMAAACVPVDIYRYNNLFDYDSGTGLLAHESPESIANAIISLLTDPKFRSRRAEKAIKSVSTRSLEWEMDVAVNAVDMGINGFNFDMIEHAQPSYTDEPIIAPEINRESVRHFLKHQWALANP